MSRPDRAPRVAVDFAPPGSRSRRGPVLALVLVVLMLVGLVIAVTQLLLR